MTSAASIVTYSVDAENADELTRQVRVHLVPAAQSVTGYQGFLLLDQGEGKRMAILLFDSVEAVKAAQQTLGSVGRDHTYALMSGPAIGSIATILVADGVLDQG